MNTNSFNRSVILVVLLLGVAGAGTAHLVSGHLDRQDPPPPDVLARLAVAVQGRSEGFPANGDGRGAGKENRLVVDPASEVARERVREAYRKLPLIFEANQGQTDSRVKFLSRGRGYSLFLTPTETVLVLQDNERGMMHDERKEPAASFDIPHSASSSAAVLRMTLVGANPAPHIVGLEEQPGKSNYFLGNHSTGSGAARTNIPNYARVRYEKVYPGVDLVYHGRQQQLEYDFIVAPGVDPGVIRLSFQGAERIAIDDRGDLVLQLTGGEVRQHKPIVYQEVDGKRVEIAGAFTITRRESDSQHPEWTVVFEVGDYDASQPLVIDPVLSYSTYLGGAGGGTGDDRGFSIAVDALGNAYATGTAGSLSFPTASSLQATHGGGALDVFVTKLSPDGNLIYSTFLGGGGDDHGRGIAVDAAGNACVTGFTFSDDFPTLRPFQAARAGSFDAFVAKLSAGGDALVYST